MLERPRLVLFDWDGTLINSFDNIATAAVEASKVLSCEKLDKAQVYKQIGLPIEDFYTNLFPNHANFSEFLETYHECYYKLPVAKLFPKVISLLQYLQSQDIIIAIVTNKSRLSLMFELDQCGLAGTFDSLWVAEELAPKPSPLMLHHALTSHQVSPRDTWMVGDALPDVYAADNAGCEKTIIVQDISIPSWIDRVVKIHQLSEIIDMLEKQTARA